MEVRAQCEYARVEKSQQDASVDHYSKQGQREDTKDTESKKHNRKRRSNITLITRKHT